jgi:nucleotide-binding universal stress UspA family protein
MDARAPLTVGQARITRVLHPTDFSAGSVRAFDYAVLLARLAGAELHLLHVVVPPEGVPASETALKKACREAEKRLVGLVGHAAGVADVWPAVRVGSPSVEVIRYAHEAGVDLVVMGTVGAHGDAVTPIGSLAEKIVRGVAVPVLTVAAPAAREAVGRRCSLCGQAATDVICDGCKDRVRGEATLRTGR